jgi:hypothetical protein
VIVKVILSLVSLQAIAGCAGASIDPQSTVIPGTSQVIAPESSLQPDMDGPPIPYVGGVDTEIQDVNRPEETDCVDAESLCEEGALACDDLADHCDVGPDGLEERPDEYDWDGS